MKFRFSLQPLLDEREREEESARACFLHAQGEYRRASRALREAESVSAACDRSAFIVLDGLERVCTLARREAEQKRSVQEETRVAFERARALRMPLTHLRERAYGLFLEAEERKEIRELEEGNATLSRLRLCASYAVLRRNA